MKRHVSDTLKINVDAKRRALFEKRKPGNRKQDRHYVQLTDAYDDLDRQSKKRRKRRS